MTGKVINLRTTRKRAARSAKQQKAAQNAALHGRTKAERHHEAARKEQETRALDGRFRERGAENTGQDDTSE